MNLYVFNEFDRTATYGIGTYSRELALALRQSRINVCIVWLLSDKPQVQEEVIDDIRYLFFPAPAVQRTLNIRKQFQLYYRSIINFLQLYMEDKKDLIFQLNFVQIGGLPAALKKNFDCRVITVIHSLEWGLGLSGNATLFRNILQSDKTCRKYKYKKQVIDSYRKEKTFFETVDHIIALSENTRQILQNDYQIEPDKISVIYNGLTDRSSVADKLVLRQKYRVPDVSVILFVGRLDNVKGLMYALRAFRKVLKIQSNCRFIIAGNGAFDIYMKECEDIWMNVTWTGLIGKDKLNELYAIADVGVVPSLYEPFGYVAAEMMMYGLPIVTTATSGLNEVVDEISGLKVPVIEYPDRIEIDTDLLADKILYLLKHPKEAKQMGQNARQRYLLHYSSDVFRENMLKFYHSLFLKI